MSYVLGSLYSISFFGITLADPLLFIQNMIITKEVEKAFFFAIIIPILLALIFGKVFCSFFCPVNTIIEHFIKLTKRKNVDKTLKGNLKIRYIPLMLLIIGMLLFKEPLANYFSLPGMLSLEIQQVMSTKVFSLFWYIFGFLLVIEILIKKRLWCNFICPQGTFIGVFRTKKTLKIVRKEKENGKCTGCKLCVASCPFYLNPMGKEIYPACTNCLECYLICKKTHKEDRSLELKF